ncbi:hypothetical protein IWW50_005665, partial [Coemansia erecta]
MGPEKEIAPTSGATLDDVVQNDTDEVQRETSADVVQHETSADVVQRETSIDAVQNNTSEVQNDTSEVQNNTSKVQNDTTADEAQQKTSTDEVQNDTAANETQQKASINETQRDATAIEIQHRTSTSEQSTRAATKQLSDLAEKIAAETWAKDDDDDEDDADARDTKNLGSRQSIIASMTLRRRILTMSALSLSTFIGSIEQTIVASSLPAIAENYNALDSVNWVATSFLLASTATQPLFGRLSDIFGRVQTLITGLIIFLIGAAIAGAAQSLGMLIGGRVVQGLGASALISLVMVIVSDISIERERAKVTSVFAAIWAASSVLGPVLGGVFTQSSGGWRWVFYFSLPVGGVAGIFIVTFLHLPRPHGSFVEKLRRVDFFGMIVLVGGAVMLLLALSFGGQDYKWTSPIVLCLLILGIAVIGIFVLIEWKIPKEPIMPLRLFKNRNVGIALAQQVLVGAAMYGPVFYVPIYFSVVKNSSPIGAGLHLLPFLLPITIFSVATGFAVSKTGRYREFQSIGSGILTLGIGLLVLFNENVTTGKSIGILIVSGIGLGILMQPQLLCLQTAVMPRDIATGTTMYVAMRSLGGSIGLAVFQTVQLNQLTSNIAPLYTKYAEYKDLIDMSIKNQAAIYYDTVPSDLRAALIHANVKSLRSVFYTMIPFAGLMFVLSLCLKHIPLRTTM